MMITTIKILYPDISKFIRIWSVLKIPRLSLLIIWFEKWQIKEEKLGDFLARRFVSNIEPEIFHSFWRRPKIPELIRSTRIDDGWMDTTKYWQRKLNKVKSISTAQCVHCTVGFSCSQKNMVLLLEFRLGPFIKVVCWPWFSCLKYLKNKLFWTGFKVI